jgi:phosphopantothenoylcysteine decarboxylase/phosphopantothenate--cysteine ligase
MNIILGICGGIAAYKTPDLVRKLTKAGHQVQCVMTHSAFKFAAPLALQAVSGRAVRTELFDEQAEAAMGHIELARWADAILIAPATAHKIAQLSYGLADDLLSTLCLASSAPLLIAPAMNQQMWAHPATQENIERLVARGVNLLGPAEGEQACGENGPGRMLEAEEIIRLIENAF